jgi:hypothetical protein
VKLIITMAYIGGLTGSSEGLSPFPLSKFSKFMAEELEKVASMPRRTRCPTAEFIMVAILQPCAVLSVKFEEMNSRKSCIVKKQ